MSKKKRRTEFENELPPDAKAPPHAGKVMRDGPAETASVRAKSSGHGKKTADKWNQRGRVGLIDTDLARSGLTSERVAPIGSAVGGGGRHPDQVRD